MSLAKVCIVTPIHNEADATLRFLESVSKLTYPDVEVIIVDDGSTDESVRLIREWFAETVILSGAGNLWWARATNLGVEEALARGAAFVYTVNNDVVLEPEAISAGISCLSMEPRALVGSTVHYLDDPDRIWFAGAALDRASGDIVHQTSPIPEDQVRESQMLTGMGTLIPAAAFDEIGAFDDRAFPHYLADCDFSLRAAQAGFRLLVTPRSKVYNDVASAWSVRQFERGKKRFLFEMLFSKRSAYWVAGRRRFYRRYWGRGYVWAMARMYARWFRVYAAPLFKRSLMKVARLGRGR